MKKLINIFKKKSLYHHPYDINIISNYGEVVSVKIIKKIPVNEVIYIANLCAYIPYNIWEDRSQVN